MTLAGYHTASLRQRGTTRFSIEQQCTAALQPACNSSRAGDSSMLTFGVGKRGGVRVAQGPGKMG